MLGIYIRFGSYKYSPFRQHERGRRCHIRIFPTPRKKTVLLRTASSLSSCSGSLTQSTAPNEEKHKSYLFLSLLLRGFSKINILEVFVPWISLFVPSQLSLYAVFVIFQIQITFLTTYAKQKCIFIRSIFFFSCWLSSALIFFINCSLFFRVG